MRKTIKLQSRKGRYASAYSYHMAERSSDEWTSFGQEIVEGRLIWNRWVSWE